MLTRKQHELLVFIDRHLRETGFSPSFDEMKAALGLRSKSGIHRLISALEERQFLGRRRHRARALEVLRMPEMPAAALRAASGAAARLQIAPAPSATAAAALASHVTSAATPSGAASPGPASTGATPPVPGTPFSPNVIKGDFTRSLAGVQAAREAGAVQLPLYGRIAAGLPIEALRDQTAQIEVPMALLGRGEHYALEIAGDSMIDAGILDGDTVIIRRDEEAENGQIIVALIDEAEVTLKRLRRRGNSIALEPANPRHEIRIFPSDRVRVQGRLVGLLRQY